MENNWKEELNKSFWETPSRRVIRTNSPDGTSQTAVVQDIERFIEKEVIKNLINDIPDMIESGDQYHIEHLTPIKQQLRTKWLGGKE